MQWQRTVWALAAAGLLLWAGCDGDGGAGGADAAADAGADAGGTDALVQETGGGGAFAEQAGVYVFVSGTFEGGTLTDRFQGAPKPGQPDREVKAVGGLVLRADGTFTRVLNVLERVDDGAECVAVNLAENRVDSGSCTQVGEQVTTLDDEGDERTATFTYEEATGLLTIDFETAEPGDVELAVWRRRALDERLPGTYDLASLEREDGVVVPAEGIEVAGVTYRVEGELEGRADGTFTRRIALFADTTATFDETASGVWFTDGSELGVVLPDEDRLVWTYVYDEGAGRLTQSTDDSADLVGIVWERRAP